MNSFQTIVLGIFSFFIVAGLIAIATVKSRGDVPATQLAFWGSAPSSVITPLISEFIDADLFKVTYREIPPQKFDQELLESLASGKGPDMVLLPASLLLRYRDKIVTIPYATYSDRLFRDTYIQGGEIFLSPAGVSAFPFSLDPLLMYYNRDILEEESIVTPPKFWDEFIALGKALTLRDDIGNIERSAVALGEFRNIANAKEIIVAMLLQSGNPVIERRSNGLFYPTLEKDGADSVLDFYTEFANPLKQSYSWNRAQKNSRDAFLSARLAVYFGFGSEFEGLTEANPNLNFDAAFFPRPRNASVALTYGKLTGLAVLKTARNSSAALSVVTMLASPVVEKKFIAASGLPPVRRSLISLKPTDAYGSILYDSAIRARGFLDPNPAASTPVFQAMIESITSGKERSAGALGVAAPQLRALIR